MSKEDFLKDKDFKERLEKNYQKFQKISLSDLGENVDVHIEYNSFVLKSKFAVLSILFDEFIPGERENFDYNTVKIEFYIHSNGINLYTNIEEFENIHNIINWIWEYNCENIAYTLFSLEKDAWYNTNNINLNGV
ncbi:MAG TPA: hypothetical protein P5513_07425 [Candidatus Diapherotrites archaeon]|nr:hypothetical protein [Candidatus Diapherotrites archaeon]